MRPTLRHTAIAFLQTALRLLIILIVNYATAQDAHRARAFFELEHGGNLFRLRGVNQFSLITNITKSCTCRPDGLTRRQRK